MTTATRSVAVVATRLPNIDRRALSQAWYSALHLNQAQPEATRAHPASAAISSAIGPRIARTGKPDTAAAPVAARGPVTELSRRIETLLVRHAANVPVRPATLALKAGDGRVQLLVRGDGAATRVVALCPAHLRDRVDRALAHARFALAAAGNRIEAARL